MRSREAQIKHNKKNEEKRINRKRRRKECKYYEFHKRLKERLKKEEVKIPRPEKEIEIPKPAAQIIKEPELLKKESIWVLLIWLPLKRLLQKVKRIFRG